MRKMPKYLEGIRGDARHVPEQIQREHALESCEAGEPLVRERPVDQKMRGFVVISSRGRMVSMPRLEHRKLMQHRQPCVCHEPARIQSPQSALAAQSFDGPVACWRSHQIHDLEVVAKLQVGRAGVGDSALPGHVECAEIAQMTKDLQSTIVEVSARIFT